MSMDPAILLIIMIGVFGVIYCMVACCKQKQIDRERQKRINSILREISVYHHHHHHHYRHRI